MNIALKMKVLGFNGPQIALAREVGISEAQLSRIVNDWSEPQKEVKEKLAKALKCRVEEIFPTKKQAT